MYTHAVNLASALSGASRAAGHNAGPLAHIWDSAPAWVVAGVVFLVAVAALVKTVEPLGQLAVFLGRPVQRLFKRPGADEQFRVRQRQGFARHVAAQLNALAVKEDWRDDRFAELEAEVEVEGRERIVRWLRHSPSRNVSLRREKSLSRGLARTTDNLVILEGEPGSGKSVALRHLAEQLAREAQNSRSVTSLIPLYVNLKEFRALQRPVDGRAVRDFVLESLTRSNDRDVEQFLEDEFDRGMRDGSWLLLLDSFDEIPDVLSSTESDNAVAEYALAINSFLSGMRSSRAIVASREFRGPKTFRVPRFTIVALTAKQQNDLIKRSGLKPDQQGTVHAGLAIADPELQQMAKNPMFLGLVCEYVRSAGTFPPNSHSAYDSYLEQRLLRDADRIRSRYGVGPDLVRAIAEEIAFCMADSEGLGLSPGRLELRSALVAAGRLSAALLDKVLDALEYTKLGRAAEQPGGDGLPHFTFAHRRFQEYFATRVVLRAPDRVCVHDLVTNGRWRETAVTILQTQPPEATVGLLDESRRLLAPMVDAVTQQPGDGDPQPFAWPEGCMHILQLLDAGLGRAADNIPADLRGGVGRLLRAVWERGRRHDRKWAASVSLVADRETTIWLLERAFASGSIYLAGSAYAGVSRLPDPPDSLYRGVRQTLVDITASGQLSRDRVALKAQISRLPSPAPLLRVLRLLSAAQAIYLLIGAVILAADAGLLPRALAFDLPLLLLAAPAFPMWLSRRADYRETSGMVGVIARRPILTLISLGSGLAVFAVSVLLLIFSHTAPRALICAITLYFVAWPICVGDACTDDYATRIAAWPCIPIYTFCRSIDVKSLLQWKRFTGLVVATLSLIAAFSLMILITYAWDHSIYVRVPLIVLGSALAALVGGAISTGFVDDLRNRRHDTGVISELARRGRDIDASTLLNALGSVRTARGARSVLDCACGVDLARYPATLLILSDLGAVIESENPETAALGPEVKEWLQAASKRARKALSGAGNSMLDRIARVVERAEMERQGESAPL
jgi:hypothetical protein